MKSKRCSHNLQSDQQGFCHSRPQSPSFLGHVVRNGRLQIKPSGSGDENGLLPADLCTDHAHYVKNHRSTVHSRPQSPSFLGHVVRKRGALEAAVTILTSGCACAKVTNITAHAHNGFLSLTAPLGKNFYFPSSLQRVASLGCFENAPLHSTWIH